MNETNGRNRSARAGAVASTNAEDFFGAVRREVLSLLAEEGGLTIPEIPREWPVTRLHVRYAVFELVEEGLVEEAGTGAVPGQPLYRPTARGLRVLSATAAEPDASAA